MLVANVLNLSFPTKCSKFYAPISNLHQILPDSGKYHIRMNLSIED